MQLTDHAFEKEDEDVDKVLWDVDKVLWEMEKYSQAQLVSLIHGLYDMNEWHPLNIVEVTRNSC